MASLQTPMEDREEVTGPVDAAVVDVLGALQGLRDAVEAESEPDLARAADEAVSMATGAVVGLRHMMQHRQVRPSE